MSESTPKKAHIIAALKAKLTEDIDRLRGFAKATQEGATHEEARPENDKDTRALEQSYLARGQAQRVVEMEVGLKRLTFMEVLAFDEDTPIGLSALIMLATEDDDERWYFLATDGGGAHLEVDGVKVSIVTPASPLGKALQGKYEGDELTIMAAGKKREAEITRVL